MQNEEYCTVPKKRIRNINPAYQRRKKAERDKQDANDILRAFKIVKRIIKK